MRIQKVPHRANLPSANSYLSLKHLSLSVLLTMAVMSAGFFLLLLFSNPVKAIKTWVEHHGYFYQSHIQGVSLHPIELLRVPVNWLRALTTTTDIPQMVIDIKFKDLVKLETKRKEALAKNVLIQEKEDFVPATIRLNNRSVKVKLRLKGDYIDHLTQGKWAFRVKVKKDDHIFGLRRFSLHHPITDNYHGEPIFFEALRREGLLAPRYMYVDVILNGDFQGRMALEEHFSKELLTAQNRRESVIVKLDESLVWDAEDGLYRGFHGGIFDSYSNTMITPFRSSQVLGSSTLTENLRISTGLLRGFTQGDLPASAVFDPIQLGRFIAVAEIWGSYHCLRWGNQRFYYNPITAHLEPIGYDASIGKALPAKELVDDRNPIISAMLSDPIVWKEYVNTLERWAQDLKSGSISIQLKSIEEEYLSILHPYYPFLKKINYSQLTERAVTLLDYIKNVGGRTIPSHPKFLHIYSLSDELGPYLELANAIPQRIVIQKLYWTIPNNDAKTPLQLREGIEFPFDLPPTPKETSPVPIRIRYNRDLIESNSNVALKVSFKIKGQENLRIAEAVPYFPSLVKNPVPESNLKDILLTHSFLIWDSLENTLEVQSGHWKLKQSLILPLGVALHIGAGTTMEFDSDSALIVQGPVKMAGTVGAPIELKGLSRPSKVEGWQGLVVLKSGTPSELSYVTIRNTKGINKNGWKLTGGVTFYESDVHLNHCQFIGNQAEDAINIVRSKFTLNEVEIRKAASDGLDADFSQGGIEGGIFKQIGAVGGGDAIDLSGSRVILKDAHFEQISDKALSVGETSYLTADHLTIMDTNIGAASKDGSELILTNSQFRRIGQVALMAYTKKSEFGPGNISASHLTMSEVPINTQAQTGSEITIDGQLVKTQEINVQYLYDTLMKPGRQK